MLFDELNIPPYDYELLKKLWTIASVPEKSSAAVLKLLRLSKKFSTLFEQLGSVSKILNDFARRTGYKNWIGYSQVMKKLYVEINQNAEPLFQRRLKKLQDDDVAAIGWAQTIGQQTSNYTSSDLFQLYLNTRQTPFDRLTINKRTFLGLISPVSWDKTGYLNLSPDLFAFTECRFFFVDFYGPWYRNAFFQDCTIHYGLFTHTDNHGPDLMGANILFCDIKETKFDHGYFRQTIFYRVSFENVSFNDCNMPGAKFLWCDFKNGSFRGSTLSGVEFRDSNLKNADFRKTNIEFSDFTGSDVTGADFRGATLYKVTDLDLKKVITDSTTTLIL